MDLETKYQQTLDYLYSFVDYSLTRAFRYSPEKFDLGRMHELMRRLGEPHLAYPVIHLAGTKGKGSTATFIASALRAAGYRVGLYTSPHLQDFTERIQINGEPITPQWVVDLMEEIKPHAAEIDQITTFELMTALGFLYFARAGVNAAVIEVGLGGRLDATNVVQPLVSVITSLSYDHMAVLGNTLSQIAAEKGGIIKPGRPVVLAPQKEEARTVIQNIASERECRLIELGQEFLYADWSHSLRGQTMLLWPADEQELVNDFVDSGGRTEWEPVRLTIPLLGYHQVENAATAYAALQIARQEGLQISEEHIRTGFSNATWPGRFEVIRQQPPLVVDSAHNRDSALKLRLAIDDYFPGKPVTLLFAASEDKDIDGMMSELLPRVKQVVATETTHPRAMNAEKLVELAHRFGRPAVAVLPVQEALKKALDLAGSDGAVVAAGSIFLAAAVRECWQEAGLSQPK